MRERSLASAASPSAVVSGCACGHRRACYTTSCQDARQRRAQESTRANGHDRTRPGEHSAREHPPGETRAVRHPPGADTSAGASERTPSRAAHGPFIVAQRRPLTEEGRGGARLLVGRGGECCAGAQPSHGEGENARARRAPASPPGKPCGGGNAGKPKTGVSVLAREVSYG